MWKFHKFLSYFAQNLTPASVTVRWQETFMKKIWNSWLYTIVFLFQFRKNEGRKNSFENAAAYERVVMRASEWFCYLTFSYRLLWQHNKTRKMALHLARYFTNPMLRLPMYPSGTVPQPSLYTPWSFALGNLWPRNRNSF